MIEAELENRRRELVARNMYFCLLLREERKRQGLTQQQCADSLGISRQRYGKLENGDMSIPVAEYEAMLVFLGIPRSDGWPEEQNKSVRIHFLSVDVKPGETVRVVLRTR